MLDNGCVIFRAGDFKESCLDGRFGLLIGNSHAQAYAPSLTRSFERAGVRLVSLARPGCQPVLFSPQERKKWPHGCISMLAPFERILEKRDRIAFVIFASLWPYEFDPKEVSDLVAQFDPKTRVLLMGPGADLQQLKSRLRRAVRPLRLKSRPLPFASAPAWIMPMRLASTC